MRASGVKGFGGGIKCVVADIGGECGISDIGGGAVKTHIVGYRGRRTGDETAAGCGEVSAEGVTRRERSAAEM